MRGQQPETLQKVGHDIDGRLLPLNRWEGSLNCRGLPGAVLGCSKRFGSRRLAL